MISLGLMPLRRALTGWISCMLPVLVVGAGTTFFAPTASALLGAACTGYNNEKAPGINDTGPLGPELNSALTPNGGIYCVDFTIYNDNGSNPDKGFIEFGLIVEKVDNSSANNSSPGNFKVIGFSPYVFSNINGVDIPSGGTSTSFASPRTLLSVNRAPDLTMDGDDGMIKGNLTAASVSAGTVAGNGLVFSFTGSVPGTTVTVGGFSDSNNPTVTVANGTLNPCLASCNVAGTFSTSGSNFILNGNEDGIVSPSIGNASLIEAVPEIDGGRLPQALFLLSALYLIMRRRREIPGLA